MDSFERFSEDKLPDSCEFYSYLKEECISEKDYLHATNVWNMFKINTMGDYHDLYWKTDVLLLDDVSKKFINTCLEYYELDPSHYFSSPGLNWDAMLKMAQKELKLTSDIKMHLFIEEEMRGSISYVAKRCSKPDSKYMLFHDDKKPSQYITYLDANKLYGWEMSHYLPYGQFKWLN